MLDIFLKQSATKVIVGDTHQQIYSWRYAVNSLEKTGFRCFNLSHSFRFSAGIANLATQILFWKDAITDTKPIAIKGLGSNNDTKTTYTSSKYMGTKGKTYSVELIRTKYGEAYKPWTPELDEKLIQMFNNNIADSEIIKHFGRNAVAIRSRLRKLGLK